MKTSGFCAIKPDFLKTREIFGLGQFESLLWATRAVDFPSGCSAGYRLITSLGRSGTNIILAPGGNGTQRLPWSPSSTVLDDQPKQDMDTVALCSRRLPENSTGMTYLAHGVTRDFDEIPCSAFVAPGLVNGAGIGTLHSSVAEP